MTTEKHKHVLTLGFGSLDLKFIDTTDTRSASEPAAARQDTRGALLHRAIKRGDCEINWRSNRSLKLRYADPTTSVSRELDSIT